MSVKDCGGGWHGVYDDNGPKDAPPKRMFRTKHEAVALDSLLKVSNGKPNQEPPQPKTQPMQQDKAKKSTENDEPKQSPFQRNQKSKGRQ